MASIRSGGCCDGSLSALVGRFGWDTAVAAYGRQTLRDGSCEFAE